MARIVGYARTSTSDQVAGLEDQIATLSASGCTEIFSEQVSSVGEREQLDLALEDLVAGDTLVVTKPDRLARSTRQFLAIIDDLTKREVNLVILSMGGQCVDSRSAIGRLILTVFGGFAEFERNMMLERQRPGIIKAKQEGKYKGGNIRDPAVVDSARRMAAKGASMTQIAAALKVHRTTVARML